MKSKKARAKSKKRSSEMPPGRGQTGGSSDDPNYEGATPRGSSEETRTGMGGQGGYNKEGNPLPDPEQDYEHGKGFPKR